MEGLEIFYREAGPRDAPAVLLLHGFPSSSHMFRNLIPMLADKYHVVEDAYTSALAQLSSILPYDELYQGMKIELSANEMKCRYINDAGKMTRTRLSMRKGVLCEWVD